MLKKIIDFSIHNKLIIGLMTIGLLIYGIIETKKLPIDAVPDITDNQVQIITSSPALGAVDVERFLTFPIEQAISNISEIKQIRSFSRFGLSVVTIVFEEHTDLFWARQQVNERLQKIQSEISPSLGVPELAPITTGLGEIYQYILRPKKGFENQYSTTELRTIQDWIVRRQLLGVKGVADVSSFGGHLKQYEVSINSTKLASFQISIKDIMDALESNNQNTGGAYIEKGPTVLFIRSEGLLKNKEDIEKICVKNNNGVYLTIKDIAEVKIGHAIRFGAMTYNGEREVAGAVVMMLKGANSKDVIQNIKTKIESIQKTLPEGVLIEAFLDRTKMVNNSISTVTKNLIEGALIVIFVLVLFLGNFRAGFIVASVIPLSMLFAIILMNIFGVSGNLMSLGALDFGLIIDGAVIIVEAVLHSLQHSKTKNTMLNQEQMNQEVSVSASKMMNSAVFGQMIILIVYLPILTLQGIEGKMFKPMAQTVAFALIGAFILSLTYVPMMSSLFLSKKTTHKMNISDKIMTVLQDLYFKSLTYILNFKIYVISIVSALFILSIIILINLGGEFIPSLPEGDFAVETRVLPGSNLNTSIKEILKSEKVLLKKFPEIIKIVGKTGSSEIPTDPMPIEASDMMVILKDKKDWVSADNYNDLAEKMSKELEQVPGVSFSFQYPVAMRFNELMTGAKQDVVCKIFGENMDTLAKYAKQLGTLIHKVKGSENTYIEPVSGMPQIVINYKRAAIAQYGVDIKTINNIINASFAGQASGMIYEEEKRFDIVVRLEDSERVHLEQVQNLLVSTPNGVQMPLNVFADVQIINGINQIQRENTNRRIIVGFNVRNRDVESTVNDLKTIVEQEFKLPIGYFVHFGGSFENLKEAKNRLSIAVPISLILILILLYFAFKSIKHGLLIFSAIPLSAIGGIFALYIRDLPFSISAGIGFIALFGVAVLNGIVLIAEFNRQKHLGINSIVEIVLNGGKNRLRPVLMTAFVASLGFLPMALSNGEGAEVQRPLATVVIGGLMLSTFLTLYVLPILYLFFDQSIKNKPKTSISVLIIFLMIGINSNAQQEISLQNAIDSALKNNISLKSEQYRSEYLKKLEHSYLNIPSTTLGLEYGQINSIYKDNSFYINQNLMFPSVYKAQKTFSKNLWLEGLIQIDLKENEIKQNLRTIYFESVITSLKIELLQQTDSLYNKFLEQAQLKLKNGESNLLELKTIENQKNNIDIQLSNAKKDVQILNLRLQWLMNTQNIYKPSLEKKQLTLTEFLDSNTFKNHPFLNLLKQTEISQLSQLKVLENKLLPSISLGYRNMSMLGNGADNVLYDSRNFRFNSFQIGLGVPLFWGAQKAEIDAQKTQIKWIKNEYLNQYQTLELAQKQLYENYELQLKTVGLLEQSNLKNTQIIQTLANEQFKKGAINFMEWMMFNNNNIQTQNQYLDELKSLNNLIIQIYAINNL